MAIEVSKIWVYRIVHYMNLEYILDHGIYYRNSDHFDPNYINIGSTEIIGHRDYVTVKCFQDTVVNDYIPFYFGIRSPMLYKIKTGHGVLKRPQSEIIYLCCNFSELTSSDLQWCFTDGNAATYITEFYTDVEKIHDLDWRSINATEWKDDNADGDHDRMRKKHSEFLVKDYVPAKFVKAIVVFTEERRTFVQNLLQQKGLNIKLHLDNDYKFYYR